MWLFSSRALGLVCQASPARGAIVYVLAATSAYPMDDHVRAFSSAPTELDLCGDGMRITTAVCKEAGYDKLVAEIDRVFGIALAKAPGPDKWRHLTPSPGAAARGSGARP
jgi:hypothetical protein